VVGSNKKAEGSKSPGGAQPLTVAQRSSLGEAARAAVPLERHAAWTAAADRPDPIALLEKQAEARVAELVPIRYGRMLVSPFAFYRGAAYLMASDLAGTPMSGLKAQVCGDAHIANFGLFASPERDLVFDLNDFDETTPGPWEWDVKRLAASLVVAGRDLGHDKKRRAAAALEAVRAYREAMRGFAAMKNLEVWYAKLDSATAQTVFGPTGGGEQVKDFDREAAKARRKNNTRAFEKLTHSVEGKPRLISDPPLLVPLSELMTGQEQIKVRNSLEAALQSYKRTLPADRRRLIETYHLVDVARKVVGVGSVGTRTWVALLLGLDERDPMFLQIKEAQESVLSGFVGRSGFRNQGQRVVEGQRLMQATSDILLGWERLDGLDGPAHDFYLRQLWDEKGSLPVEEMLPGQMLGYAHLCGWTLARAHARSGDRVAIASYLGKSDAFDRAVAVFSEAYADQNRRDYQSLQEAVKSGRLKAEMNV
jgi:uncharacterized protein (DUF2252 family)